MYINLFPHLLSKNYLRQLLIINVQMLRRGLENREGKETVYVVPFDYYMGIGVEFWENRVTKVRCQYFHSRNLA